METLLETVTHVMPQLLVSLGLFVGFLTLEYFKTRDNYVLGLLLFVACIAVGSTSMHTLYEQLNGSEFETTIGEIVLVYVIGVALFKATEPFVFPKKPEEQT